MHDLRLVLLAEHLTTVHDSLFERRLELHLGEDKLGIVQILQPEHLLHYCPKIEPWASAVSK